MRFTLRKTHAAFLLLLTMMAVLTTISPAKAQQTKSRKMTFLSIPIWFHVHTNLKGDGGGVSPVSTVEYLKSKGYTGIVFTPHSYALPLQPYASEIEVLNTPDFIAVPGREIGLTSEMQEDGLTMCHINAISGIEKPPLPERSYKNLDDVFGQFKTEKAISVWNHPWACRAWLSSASRFSGIELFNDSQFEKNYTATREIFLQALKNGARPFVISGIDMHSMIQTKMGEYTTYVFPLEFTRESLLKAMLAGHTIAAYNSMVFYLNEKPSLQPLAAPHGEFAVEGSVGLKPYNSYKHSIIVYKDGIELKSPVPATFTKGERVTKGYTTYDFSFGDKLAPGETSCYVFEIPHFMFSSPYCYTAVN